MPDRELVITHLQIIHTWADFARDTDVQFFTKKHLEDIAQWSDDAINLLEEQDAVPVIKREDACMFFWCCGSCGVAITEGDKFCRKCGRSVKWE